MSSGGPLSEVLLLVSSSKNRWWWEAVASHLSALPPVSSAFRAGLDLDGLAAAVDLDTERLLRDGDAVAHATVCEDEEARRRLVRGGGLEGLLGLLLRVLRRGHGVAGRDLGRAERLPHRVERVVVRGGPVRNILEGAGRRRRPVVCRDGVLQRHVGRPERCRHLIGDEVQLVVVGARRRQVVDLLGSENLLRERGARRQAGEGDGGSDDDVTERVHRFLPAQRRGGVAQYA